VLTGARVEERGLLRRSFFLVLTAGVKEGFIDVLEEISVNMYIPGVGLMKTKEYFNESNYTGYHYYEECW